jgi:hypothetical protein
MSPQLHLGLWVSALEGIKHHQSRIIRGGKSHGVIEVAIEEPK